MGMLFCRLNFMRIWMDFYSIFQSVLFCEFGAEDGINYSTIGTCGIEVPEV